jgi:hypothetical protein
VPPIGFPEYQRAEERTAREEQNIQSQIEKPRGFAVRMP